MLAMFGTMQTINQNSKLEETKMKNEMKIKICWIGLVLSAIVGAILIIASAVTDSPVWAMIGTVTCALSFVFWAIIFHSIFFNE